MEISKEEILILNTYASNELAGALAAGRKARKVSDPYIRRKLTWHCAEEARHATMFYEIMRKIGIPILNLHNEKNKKSYWKHVSEIEDIDEFLCLCHVYELRAPFHHQIHKEWTKIPEIKKLLQQLIIEEGPHLEWIKDYLLTKTKKGKKEIFNLLSKSFEFENQIYHRDFSYFDKSEGEIKDFLIKIKEKSKHFEDNIKKVYFERWKK